MKMKVLVVICCLFFTQQVFAQAFPPFPTAKQLYELIDDGKVLGTFFGGGDYPLSTTVVLHPKYGLVTCFQTMQTGSSTQCSSAEK